MSRTVKLRCTIAPAFTAGLSKTDRRLGTDMLRRTLSYSNVMATLAVLIALGGSSYAALSITGRNVKDGSLTFRDLRGNTVRGAQISESTLGRVPRARNADRLNGVTASRLF